MDHAEEMNLVWETWQRLGISNIAQEEWIWHEFGDPIKSNFIKTYRERRMYETNMKVFLVKNHNCVQMACELVKKLFREDYEMITVISDAYKQCRVLRVTNNTKTFLVKTNLLVITVFEVRPLDLLLEDFQSSPV